MKVVGDSLNEKEIPVEQVTFDKEGRTLAAKYYSSYSSHISRQEKSVIAGNVINTYECECADLSRFVKSFEIRNKEELKHQEGGATDSQPTEYFTAKTLDKKGNVVLEKRYSVNGYQVSEIKSTFNASGNLITKIVYDFYDSISYNEKNTYDKNGNLTERISKRINQPFEIKELFKYSTDNRLKEELTYENEILKSNFEYSEVQTGNKKELFKSDKLKGTKYIHQEIFYDLKNMEARKTDFFSDSSISRIIETVYYENGKIKTKLFYDSQNNLIRKISFVNDKNNNWYEWTTYILTTTILKDSKYTSWKSTLYKLKVEYIT